jgi:hypothetical protein
MIKLDKIRALKRIYTDRHKHRPYLDWFYNEKGLGIPFDKANDPVFKDWHLKYYNALKSFQNKHLGEDCFIIGNGPSLNKMDLSLLDGYHVFGLNKIYLMLKKQEIDFSYLVAVNPLVIEQSREIYEKMNIPIFLSYDASEKISCPHIYKIRTTGEFRFAWSISDVISEGYTVTYVAIQLAYLMGFKRVFLIGVDHNFQQVGNPNSEQVLTSDDPNHFDPDYFKGQKWHLADLEGNDISYRIAKKMFEHANRKIYNSTLGGKLEIFERLTFEDALKIAKKKSP